MWGQVIAMLVYTKRFELSKNNYWSSENEVFKNLPTTIYYYFGLQNWLVIKSNWIKNYNFIVCLCVGPNRMYMGCSKVPSYEMERVYRGPEAVHVVVRNSSIVDAMTRLACNVLVCRIMQELQGTRLIYCVLRGSRLLRAVLIRGWWLPRSSHPLSLTRLWL